VVTAGSTGSPAVCRRRVPGFAVVPDFLPTPDFLKACRLQRKTFLQKR
jgi:hypothetical protein